MSSETETKARKGAASAWAPGLSAKLLLLTIVFVMVAEILVFVPSVSNFRRNWLKERLAAAQIAALASEGAKGDELPETLQQELLLSAQVHAVALKRDDTRRLILQWQMPATVAEHFDLRSADWWDLIVDAMDVYLEPPGRYIRVVGQPSFGAGQFIEIVINEDPLRAAMIRFGLNILGLSIVISIITAALVYLALNALLVQPMTALTRNMVRFSEDPEDPQRIIEPSARGDEIGIAERELAAMQTQLSETLHQKSRLAALGLAVSKVNHDLRNMLATAQLVSDRLTAVKDPTVQRFAPKLITSIDRAIRLCTETLNFGRAQEAPPERAMAPLRPLVEEVGESLGLPDSEDVVWVVDVAAELQIDADPDHLHRVLANLGRNAVQALEALRPRARREVRVSARREGSVVVIEVSDTGPGVPEKAREHLFEAFHGTTRKGGTGLGLAIAAELVRAHGGSIELVDTDTGATFRLTFPDRVVELRPRRSA